MTLTRPRTTLLVRLDLTQGKGGGWPLLSRLPSGVEDAQKDAPAGTQDDEKMLQTHSDADGAIFREGEGGYAFYRIPALLRMGTILLAFAEGRMQRQDHGKVDIVLRRSLDDGTTWSPISVVHSEPGQNTIGNPAPLYDAPETVLIFCRGNQEVLKMSSVDDGLTWSAPSLINWSRPPDWTWVATGPPASLRLSSGRWLVPCDGLIGDSSIWKATRFFSFVLLSDDRGMTWKQSNLIDGGNECQAVEMSDGTLLLNMRSTKTVRLQSRSTDGGETWSTPPQTAQRAVVDGNAQGSMIALDPTKLLAYGDIGTPALLATSTGIGRRVLTARTSQDGGLTWQTHEVVEPQDAAYSALVDLGGGRVGCLYETRRERRRVTAGSPPTESSPSPNRRVVMQDVLRFTYINVSDLIRVPTIRGSSRSTLEGVISGSSVRHQGSSRSTLEGADLAAESRVEL